MKKEKESLSFKFIWFSFMFAPMFGIVGLVLIPLKLDTYLHLLISVFVGIIYAKNIIDNQDLDNKIFELKELIEKQSK